MMIANRLVFFSATLLTYYACAKYPSTVAKKGPLVIKRTLYVTSLITLSYILSGLIYQQTQRADFRYGNQIVTDLVTVALIDLVITSLSFLAPKHDQYLTADLKKVMVFVGALLALSTFTLYTSEHFIKELFVFAGMYLIFTFCFAGIKDRLSIAPIPQAIKGLPLDLLTLFLILLSFSFLNGVFFDRLF